MLGAFSCRGNNLLQDINRENSHVIKRGENKINMEIHVSSAIGNNDFYELDNSDKPESCYDGKSSANFIIIISGNSFGRVPVYSFMVLDDGKNC